MTPAWSGPIAICVAVLATVAFATSGTAAPQEIPMTPEMRQRMTEAIQDHYPCPIAKFALHKGQNRHGTVVQVHCGPLDKKHSAFDQVYRVIFAPTGMTFIERWRHY